MLQPSIHAGFGSGSGHSGSLHDARATALTHLARKVDVLTLAKISRHKNLSLLSNVYYRATPEQIAAKL